MVFWINNKMFTNRFFGLGAGWRGGWDMGPLSQKHLEGCRVTVLHCKAPPSCLKGGVKMRNQDLDRSYWMSHRRKKTTIAHSHLYEWDSETLQLPPPSFSQALSQKSFQIPEWGRQLQGFVCWSVSVFASAAPSGQTLNLRFPVNNTTE